MADPVVTTTPVTTSTPTSVVGAAAAPEAAEAAAKPTVGDKLYDGKTATPEKIVADKTAEEIKTEADAKVAADKVAADAKAEADKAKPAEGETKYDLKLPEGVKPDEKSMADFTALLGKNKVPADVAQGLIDLHYAQMKSLTEAASAANSKLWTDTQSEWRSALDKDPELGGDRKAAVAARLGKALDEFGSREAREAFDLTGAGNNPHIVRFINKMAAALVEGGPVQPGGPTDRKGQTLGQKLYGG